MEYFNIIASHSFYDNKGEKITRKLVDRYGEIYLIEIEKGVSKRIPIFNEELNKHIKGKESIELEIKKYLEEGIYEAKHSNDRRIFFYLDKANEQRFRKKLIKYFGIPHYIISFFLVNIGLTSLGVMSSSDNPSLLMSFVSGIVAMVNFFLYIFFPFWLMKDSSEKKLDLFYYDRFIEIEEVNEK